MKIALLATGIGNVRSVLRALDRVVDHATVEATADPEVVRRADLLVMPGQGSFGAFADAMHGALGEALVERIRAGTPYLGICLGLQVLFEESDEAPGARGLGLFRGRVRRLVPGIGSDGAAAALPHMGWNRVVPASSESGLLADDHFYFAHTFAAAPEDERVILARTEYGETFASAVHRDNIVGVQFHPEKSQRAGLAFLSRFFSRFASKGP